jgi:cell volume regulation protein A
LAAILSIRIGERIRIPPPALFLIGAALMSDLVSELGRLDITTVQDVVTAALVLILFDGGMHVELKRLRSAAGAVIWIGSPGRRSPRAPLHCSPTSHSASSGS